MVPQKNIIKTYVENAYYHVYNRGVEKRTIFEDEIDYYVFMNYLKEYLTPAESILDETSHRRVINYSQEIDLVAFCLMPNHFHLLLKQSYKNSMSSFVKSLSTRYSMYFNKKYTRVGKLFQSHYKARIITTDSDIINLSRYIHLNPLELTKDIEHWHSSYSAYIRKNKCLWIKPEIVLDQFDNGRYKNFVESFTDSKKIERELQLD